MRKFFGNIIVIFLGIGALAGFLAYNGKLDDVRNAVQDVAGIAEDSAPPVDGGTVDELAGGLPSLGEIGSNVEVTAARAQLALLRTADSPVAGFSDSGWSSEWVDIDRNGCSTINDVLTRDLTATTVTGNCTVTAGTFTDPGTGQVISYVKGGGLLAADHVVSAADAWGSGAEQWSPVSQAQFMNDLKNVNTVAAATAAERGGRSADLWLPAEANVACSLVRQQISVKDEYKLSVTSVERSSMSAALNGCGA